MINTYVALDVGEARVGVAVANDVARIAAPLEALKRGKDFNENLDAILQEHQPTAVVVGWPRGLEGQHTQQTYRVEEFASQLEAQGYKVDLQDEAATSIKAEAELKKSKKAYSKGAVDSLSAVYILEDYLQEKVQ